MSEENKSASPQTNFWLYFESRLRNSDRNESRAAFATRIFGEDRSRYNILLGKNRPPLTRHLILLVAAGVPAEVVIRALLRSFGERYGAIRGTKEIRPARRGRPRADDIG